MTANLSRINLLGLDLQGLENFFADIGEKPFRARQVLKWIHQHRVVNFADMTNLTKTLRDKLNALAEIKLPAISKDYMSQDGTRKWLIRLSCGNLIESVYIPASGRGTLCVSSQVGCTLACTFCATGYQGFNRNLDASEIIGQLWLANDRLARDLKGHAVTNVVMMGMGEPLANYKNVVTAMKLMRDDLSYGISWRRLTLSTAGIVPMIDKLREDCHVSLAISLHATHDKLRSQLMPLNNKYPIADLLFACRRYIAHDKRRHITVEYVLLAGINDSVKDGVDLIALLRNLRAKVNLIPFNPFPGTHYLCSAKTVINRFKKQLSDAGLVVTVRQTRGDDIIAACGQLVGKVKDRTRRTKQIVAPSVLEAL